MLVLAWDVHPRYRLVVAANRDEFHARPAAPLSRWDDGTGITGGRDLRAGGTWLAVRGTRRFGVITNFRDGQPSPPGSPSRGELIPQFLAEQSAPQDSMRTLDARAPRYGGFNLLLADEQALWYGSNRARPFARALAAGVYGLSNDLLDTPTPKLARVREAFGRWLETRPADAIEPLLAMLADRTQAPPQEPPAVPGPRAWERALSAPFVRHPEYGTRCSTVVLIERTGAGLIRERRFDAAGEPTGDSEIALTTAP